jgi:hypothetical protein
MHLINNSAFGAILCDPFCAWPTRGDTIAALDVMMAEVRLQFFRLIFGAADPGRAPLISHQKK